VNTGFREASTMGMIALPRLFHRASCAGYRHDWCWVNC